jgi:hypothetical protein
MNAHTATPSTVAIADASDELRALLAVVAQTD